MGPSLPRPSPSEDGRRIFFPPGIHIDFFLKPTRSVKRFSPPTVFPKSEKKHMARKYRVVIWHLFFL